MTTLRRTVVRLRRFLGRLASDFPTEATGLIRRAFWRLAARFTPVIGVERDGLHFVLSTRDLVLSRRLFVYHRSPEHDIELAFSALRSIPAVAERLSGCTVVEVGANIGSHTVEMLKRYDAAYVIAIEPAPENFRLLRHNLIANDLEDRVHALQLALSSHDGAVELELSGSNLGDHRVSVSQSSPANRDEERATVQVKASRLDSLVRDGTIELDSVGLVWMDAQGHEGHILQGAELLLRSDIPIVMEYWPYGLRQSGGLADLHELVASHYQYVMEIARQSGASPRVIRADWLPRLEDEYGWVRGSFDPDAGTDLILSKDLRRSRAS